MENEFSNIRRSVKHRMIDLDLDREGSYDIILPHLSAKVGRQIKKSTLCMALTGSRSGQAYKQLLEMLQEVLDSWPPKSEGPILTP